MSNLREKCKYFVDMGCSDDGWGYSPECAIERMAWKIYKKKKKLTMTCCGKIQDAKFCPDCGKRIHNPYDADDFLGRFLKNCSAGADCVGRKHKGCCLNVFPQKDIDKIIKMSGTKKVVREEYE